MNFAGILARAAKAHPDPEQAVRVARQMWADNLDGVMEGNLRSRKYGNVAAEAVEGAVVDPAAGRILQRQLWEEIAGGDVPRELREAVRTGRTLDLGEYGAHGAYTARVLDEASNLAPGRSRAAYAAERLPAGTEGSVRVDPMRVASKFPEQGAGGALLAGTTAATALGAALGGFGADDQEKGEYMAAGLGGGIPSAVGKFFKQYMRDSLSRAADAADATTKAGAKSEVGEAIRQHLGPKMPYTERPRTQRPNLDRIEADPDVKRLIKNTYRALDDKVLEHARIVTPKDETERLAYETIRSGRLTYEKLLAMEPGTILNAHEGRAARILEVTAAEHGMDLARRAMAGEALPPGELRRSLAFLGEVSEKVYGATKAEPGRALGDLTTKVKGMKGYDLSVDIDRVREASDLIDPSLGDKEIAEVMTQYLKEPAKVALWSRGLKTFGNLAVELMYGAMLSGKALVKNLLGNGLYAAVSIGDRAIEGQITRIARGLGAETKGWVQPGEATQMAYAYWESMVEQARLWKDLGSSVARRDGTAIREVAERIKESGGKGAASKLGNREPAWTAQNLGLDPTSNWGMAVDIFGKVVRTGPSILNLEDASFRAINGRMSMRATALRQAIEDGFQGPALFAEAERRMEQPTLRMLREVEYYKAENTFTKDFEGRLGQMLQGAQATSPVQLGALPFFKTLVRIAEAGMTHTPGLNLATKQYWQMTASGGRRAVEAQAKLVTGAAFVGLGMWLESQGLITGSGPVDPKVKKGYKNAGWQPYSIYNPVTEKYYSFAGLEPVATLLATAADISRYARSGGAMNAGSLFWAAAIAQMDHLVTQPFALGLSHLLEVTKSKDPDKWLDLAQEKILQFYPAMAREVGAYTSEGQKEKPRVQRGEQRGELMVELRLLLDKAMRDVPGWGGKPERDPITGEVKVLPGADPFTFMNPFRASQLKSDVHVEVARLAEYKAFPSIPDVIHGRDPGQLDVEQGPEELQGVRLNDDEKDRWQVLMTSMKLGGKTLEERLHALITSERYERMEDPRRALEVWHAANAYKQSAKQALLREDGDLRMAVFDKARSRGESMKLKPKGPLGGLQEMFK
jgi:hypothetical protein